MVCVCIGFTNDNRLLTETGKKSHVQVSMVRIYFTDNR